MMPLSSLVAPEVVVTTTSEPWLRQPLKPGDGLNANLVITGSTRGCRNDNLWCHQ